MQANCQLFGQHGSGQRKSVWQHPDLVLADDHVFGEAALRVREAGRGPEVAGVATYVADPGEAFRAVSAGGGRVDGHRGSGGEGTGRVVLDPPDNFVAEHHGFPQAERTYGAVLVVMQIRSADTAMGVAHEDLPGFGRPGGQIVESQIVGGWSMRPLCPVSGLPARGPRVRPPVSVSGCRWMSMPPSLSTIR